MIKVVDSNRKVEIEKQDDFDINGFYKLFLYGFDCPYVIGCDGSECLRFDKDGIHLTEGLRKLAYEVRYYRNILDDDWNYIKTIKEYITQSLKTLDYSRDCNAILEVLIECENSMFLKSLLPAKLNVNHYSGLLLIMHNLKLKIDDNINVNKNRFCNYLINATLKKDNHRTYKINDNVTIHIEYERVFTHTEEPDTFATVPTEMLAVKNKFKLTNLRWNECSLFDGLELALATNVVGTPSRILIVNIWYKREKCFSFNFTPF
nr:MAG TPA: hypothetical protein [Crassvirales sp.]